VLELVVDHVDSPTEVRPPRHLARLRDRPVFFDHLRRAMLRNEGVDGGLALLVMTLDPFYVAESSDPCDEREQVRMVTAGRLIGCLHYAYITARISDDEFLVLAEGIGDVENAIELSEQILMAVRWPEDLLAEQKSVTASIGIAFQGSHMIAEQLLINADIAMYSARNDGGNQYRVFEHA
jgi:diguanylate cyclase (GGDEF)-like protein